MFSFFSKWMRFIAEKEDPQTFPPERSPERIAAPDPVTLPHEGNSAPVRISWPELVW